MRGIPPVSQLGSRTFSELGRGHHGAGVYCFSVYPGRICASANEHVCVCILAVGYLADMYETKHRIKTTYREEETMLPFVHRIPTPVLNGGFQRHVDQILPYGVAAFVYCVHTWLQPGKLDTRKAFGGSSVCSCSCLVYSVHTYRYVMLIRLGDRHRALWVWLRTLRAPAGSRLGVLSGGICLSHVSH